MFFECIMLDEGSLGNSILGFRFIKIYGYQISNEDLVTLIKLYYSLIVKEDINIPVVGCAGRAFALLLG